jgi:hypothetical protein
MGVESVALGLGSRGSPPHQCTGLVFRDSVDTEMAPDPYLGRAVECVDIVQSPSREANPLVSIDRTARPRWRGLRVDNLRTVQRHNLRWFHNCTPFLWPLLSGAPITVNFLGLACGAKPCRRSTAQFISHMSPRHSQDWRPDPGTVRLLRHAPSIGQHPGRKSPKKRISASWP